MLIMIMTHFNTSYVVIKPVKVSFSLICLTYFNTSYVVIKLGRLEDYSLYKIGFQYILCCY